MSFAREIYPYRQNRVELTTRLIRALDQGKFTNVEWVEVRPDSRTPRPDPPHYTTQRKQVKGAGPLRFVYPNKRCQFRRKTFLSGKEWVCDFTVTLNDKKTARALLAAWSGKVTDRYLDRQIIEQLAKNRRFRSVDEALALIRQNAPAGAVMFLHNEIPKWQPPLFGAKLTSDWTYSSYFSMLLKFDIERCCGLIAELHRLANITGNTGGGSNSPVIDAAMIWIRHQQQNRVGMYGLLGS